jgi:hypothetical protein
MRPSGRRSWRGRDGNLDEIAGRPCRLNQGSEGRKNTRHQRGNENDRDAERDEGTAGPPH